MNRATTTPMLIALLATALVACGDGVLADGDGVVYFTPFGTQSFETRTVDTPRPTLPEEQESNYTQVREGFAAQAPQLLNRPDVVDVLGPIEQSFLLSGNYPQLLDIYRQEFERHGTDSVAAIGLAWTYIQLGNEPASWALKDQLVTERPDDPLTWLIVGNVHIRHADASADSARRARDAFERVLELDPNFSGFKSSDPQLLRNTIDALNRRIVDEPVETPEAVAAAPMHHTDEESVDIIDTEPADPEPADPEPSDESPASEAPEQQPEPLAQREESVGGDEPEQAGEPDEVEEHESPRQAGAAHHVVLGQQALQRGSDHLSQARNHFQQALQIEPENVDANIGMLRVQRRMQATDEVLIAGVDAIADRELTAQQAFDLGLFCLRRLNDRDRATSLLKRVQQKDPSFARRVGVDSLLDP